MVAKQVHMKSQGLNLRCVTLGEAFLQEIGDLFHQYDPLPLGSVQAHTNALFPVFSFSNSPQWHHCCYDHHPSMLYLVNLNHKHVF